MNQIMIESETVENADGTNVFTTEIGEKYQEDNCEFMFSDFVRETDKAICVSRIIGYTGLNGSNYFWIPKSIAKIVRMDFTPKRQTASCMKHSEVRNVYVPFWFYRQNN